MIKETIAFCLCIIICTIAVCEIIWFYQERMEKRHNKIIQSRGPFVIGNQMWGCHRYLELEKFYNSYSKKMESK